MRQKLQTKKTNFDKKIFFLAIFLTLVGLVAIADASAPLALQKFSDKFYFLKQQIVWAVLGIVLMAVFSRVNYQFWEKIASPLFFLSLAGLALLFIPGLGIKVLGATRWLDLGFFSLQPSEFIKLTIVIYIAKLYKANKKVLAYLLPVGLAVVLIMLQPDLGTTMVIVTTSLMLIFLSGFELFRFLQIGIFASIAAFLMIISSDYRKDRLLTFLKISQDPLNEGYHIKQILLALGSGGLFGVGLGHSRQKYLFLPETATDSIFAIIAEETGFIGALILLGLLATFVFQGIKIAKHAPDKFSFLLASGISSWIGVQVIFNIGSMVALVPLTGIPLPFISVGGSSLVTILIGTGILLNISKHAKES